MKYKRSKIFKKKLKENYKKQTIDKKIEFEDMKNAFLFMEDEFPKLNLTEEQINVVSYIEYKPSYIITDNHFRKKHKFRKREYKKAIHIEGILNRYWFRARFPYPKEMWKYRSPRKLKKKLKKESRG